MNPHEEAIVHAFISPPRKERWLESLSSANRRKTFLDRLNHCRDFDERFASPLPSNANVLGVLQSHGAPPTCYVLSFSSDLDGREMPLADAIAEAPHKGWGTIISCIPGRLAYYYDECGERRLLLERNAKR